jgi:hypothetical protein
MQQVAEALAALPEKLKQQRVRLQAKIPSHPSLTDMLADLQREQGGQQKQGSEQGAYPVQADMSSRSLKAFLDKGQHLQRGLSDKLFDCSKAIDDLLSAAGDVERLGKQTNPFTAKREELQDELEQKQQEVDEDAKLADEVQQEVCVHTIDSKP